GHQPGVTMKSLSRALLALLTLLPIAQAADVPSPATLEAIQGAINTSPSDTPLRGGSDVRFSGPVKTLGPVWQWKGGNRLSGLDRTAELDPQGIFPAVIVGLMPPPAGFEQ